MNIFITSKARFDKCKTADLFVNYKKAWLVIEPQEEKQYREKYPNYKYLILGKDDGGLPYARNFIKMVAEIRGLKSYWLLDDDISNFYRREGTKLIKDNSVTILKEAKQVFKKNDIALGGIEYRQFAWSATKELITNSFCDCAVFIDVNKMKGIYCNTELKLKIDRDLCIQTIRNNKKTARLTTYAFSSPPNGSNKGGLKEIAYDKKDLEKQMCLKMVEIWGEDICRHIVKKDGRNDLKIYWDNIKSKQQSLF